MKSLSDYLLALQAALPGDGPGFSALLVRDGQPLFELHHGLACMEMGVPLSGTSRYYLASESKQFTAACALDLVRRGAIGLDDDVRAHLANIRQMPLPISLRHLLNHSSGIPDYLSCIGYQLGRHESDYFDERIISELIRKFDETEFPSGTRHDYSNSNYILLAQLVEALSGQPLAAYARALLFAPLNMHATGYDEERHSIMPGRVRSYTRDPARPFGYKLELGNASTIGDGGLYSCTADLLLWEREWHRQYADTGSLIHALLQASPDQDGVSHPYRFGLEWARHEEFDYVFHGGCLWGFNTLIVRVPQAGVSVILLSNSDSLEPEPDAIMQAVCADLRAEQQAASIAIGAA
ncbi:beta-lactamase family protein [Oxalobacteraceae bacterium]|nr:beta-lactamase family protein [Oxalobacteraceae bacterium]